MNLKDWARITRLPNLPTPLADIGLGVSASLAMGLPLNLLAASIAGLASVCLYAAGMVLNDWCDQTEDSKTRPERPIPSGGITSLAAFSVGIALLVTGVSLAAALSFLQIGTSTTSLAVAISLAGMILFYDAWAKHTPLGPLAMGACRGLNVLLGASIQGLQSGPDSVVVWLPAAISTLYIAGVTGFAKTEEITSDSLHLKFATGVITLALAMAATVPLLTSAVYENPMDLALPWVLMAVLLWILVPKLLRANRQLSPSAVQAAVGWMIALYIPLQTFQACGLIGPQGLAILPLFGIVLLLRRWRWLQAT